MVLLIAYLVTFIINIIPFFMPPTWVLLGYFRIHYDLPLWLLTVGGALCSTAGRTVLALASRHFGSIPVTGPVGRRTTQIPQYRLRSCPRHRRSR